MKENNLTTTQHPAAETPFHSTQVAPLLPPTASAPEPAGHVPFVTGLLFFWLLPDRHGPHLAVMSFWRALAAYVLSWVITVSMLVLGWAAYIHKMPWNGLQKIRLSAACGVIWLASLSASGGWMSHPVVILIATFILPQIALVILAIVLMPWCAGGDRAWSVFKRSLKNVYWCTTLLIPFSLIGAVLSITHQVWSPWLHRDKPLIAAVLLVLIVVIIMTLRALLTGAGRYVGQADGPAFHPREPLCDECGYRIVGLPLITNCPECGTPVRDSLPGGRRHPTPWQQRSGLGRLGALIQMQWQILWSPNFFKKIQVHEGLGVARQFCYATVLLALVVNLGLLKAWSDVWNLDRNLGPLIFAAVYTTAIVLIVQPLMTFVGCLWAQFGYGFRNYHVSAVVCCYASPLMWPVLLVLLATGAFAMTPLGIELLSMNYIPVGRFRINGWRIFTLLWLGLSVLGIVFWFGRLRAGLRAVRYANV